MHFPLFQKTLLRLSPKAVDGFLIEKALINELLGGFHCLLCGFEGLS